MLSFPAAIRVYLCTIPCDMRRSFDGLSMMAEHLIQCNPFSGHLLVLCNRRSDRVKILYWDRDGWAIWDKRLQAGTFQFLLVATGRKSWLFFGTDNGGRTAAVLTSFISTCKRLDIDPFAYLRDIIARISAHPQSRLAELLPDKWAAARADCSS